MTKIFGFLKNLFQLMKIVSVFCILMLILYWINNLAGFGWKWLGFISPLLNEFLNIGELVSKGSINLFEAVFEYKYFWAMVMMIAIYYFFNFLQIGAEFMEDAYHEGKKIVKKIEENKLNEDLHKFHANEQKAINKYRVFVSTSIKKKFSHAECKINLEEENKIMNRFLISKLNVSPTEFNGGFLYSFNDFSCIDGVLLVFMKLLKSSAPLDYVICVQICTPENDLERLKKLISLRFENKISMFADVVFRYKFNKAHRWGTSQLGLFQKDGDTVEVHEFIEI